MAFGNDEVRIKITADDQTRRGTDSAKRNMGQLDGSIGGIRKNWLAMGAAAGVAGVAIGSAARVAAGFVSAASDMEESVSKVNVVFGDSSSIIHDWASDSATAMGLSRQAATEAAGTFGNLFTAMGLAQDAAAEMSPAVVQLSADLASFNNIGTDEALIKLRAGLVGEVEPLRTLGVSMNAAMVEAKALELGLVGVNGELTEQAKIQARWQIIQEQSTNAAGDFERTSDGLANQLKTLNAQWDDMKTTLGTALLPIVTEGVTKFNALFEALSGIKDLGIIRVTMEIAAKEAPGTDVSNLEILKVALGIANPADQIGAAFSGAGQAINSLGITGISTLPFVPNISQPAGFEGIVPGELGPTGAGPFVPGPSSVMQLADAWLALTKSEEGAIKATERANLQIELLHERLDDVRNSTAGLNAAEQARASIIADQTNQIVEAYLQEQMGAEGRVDAVRESQQMLDEEWKDVASGLADLGVVVPDEFRSMWESMQQIQKEEQQRLLDQRLAFAEQARIAEQRILAGTAGVGDFAFAIGARSDPDLSPEESAARQAERDRFQSFLDRLLSGEVAPTMDFITQQFGSGMASVIESLIANQQVFINALGNLQPTFIVQLGDQVMEDAVVTALEGASDSGRYTKTVVD